MGLRQKIALVTAFSLVGCLVPTDVRCDESKDSGVVIQVDPEGEPRAWGKKPERPEYFIWHSDGKWHVRTRTGGKRRMFRGQIKIVDGTVSKIANYEGLEDDRGGKGKGKKAKPADLGRLNDARNRIDFQFETFEHGDGFDFTVNDKTSRLEFDLKVDGYEHREMILIGTAGKNPPNAHFSIPNPDFKPANREASSPPK